MVRHRTHGFSNPCYFAFRTTNQ